MSAFTKGPWAVKSDTDYAVNSPDHGLIAIINCEESDYGFYRDADDDGKAEGHANARLIASAPDMYEALSELVGWEMAIQTVAPELGGLLKAIWKAKSALAKAHGE